MISASAGVYQRTSDARMAPWRWAREQNVGTPCGLDLVLFRQRVASRDPGPYFLGFLALHRTLGKSRSHLLGKRLQAQPDALVGDELCGGVAHQEAVLDAGRACVDRNPDGFVGECVDGDIGAPVARRLNGSMHLGPGEGHRVDRAEWRRDASAPGELDLGGALHQLLSDANAHFVRTVGKSKGADLLAARQRTADLAGQVGYRAKIPVPASHGNHRAGWKDAWTFGEAFVDCALEPESRSADIAYRGEPTQQRILRLCRGHQVAIADVASDRFGRR